MDIQVKELDYCKVLVDFSASGDDLHRKENEIVDMFKKAPIPGNRPGKASEYAVKSYYKKQIEHSLKQAMAEEAVQQAVVQENLKPASSPQFSALSLSADAFTCQFTLLTHPQFELGVYKGFDVVKPETKISVSEMSEKIMQELRFKHSETAAFDENDTVENGDDVIIDYVGTVDGERVDNLCAEAEMFTVGTSKLTDFDASLIGMKLGETREFDMVAPETALPSLKGKSIHFSVSLTMASKVSPHALDDELAKKEGFETFDELKSKVNELSFGRVSTTDRDNLVRAVATKLVDNHQFKVPDFMSLGEAKALAMQAGINWDELKDEDKERYMVAGERNVKLSLVLRKVRDEEPDAQLSDQETLRLLKEQLEKMYPGQNLMDILAQMDKSGYTQVLVGRAQDEHVLDFITNTCKVIE